MNELEETIDEIESLEEGFSEDDFTLDEPYRPVGQLHIPQEARDAYNAKGFDLQWIRIFVPNNGGLDSRNIRTKESDLYEFVPRSEIPGLKKAMTSYFGEQLDQSNHGLYVVGDLALAKVSHKRKAAKRKFLDRRVQSRSQAIINDLRKNSVMPSQERDEGWKIETSQPKGRNTEFG